MNTLALSAVLFVSVGTGAPTTPSTAVSSPAEYDIDCGSIVVDDCSSDSLYFQISTRYLHGFTWTVEPVNPSNDPLGWQTAYDFSDVASGTVFNCLPTQTNTADDCSFASSVVGYSKAGAGVFEPFNVMLSLFKCASSRIMDVGANTTNIDGFGPDRKYTGGAACPLRIKFGAIGLSGMPSSTFPKCETAITQVSEGSRSSDSQYTCA